MLSLTPNPQTVERPPGVKAIAVLCALLALASLVFVVLLMAERVSLSSGALLLGGGLEQSGPFAFLLQATIAGLLSIGLWRGWKWSRLATIAFAAVGILLDVPAISSAVVDMRFLALARGALQTMARVMVIYYLTQDPVKLWFDTRKAG